LRGSVAGNTQDS